MIDTFTMQFPSMELASIMMGFPANFVTDVTDAKWHVVHSWSQNRVDKTYLLLTLFCTLQTNKFMFTITFRGLMSIQVYYWWVAAAQVVLLCIRLLFCT